MKTVIEMAWETNLIDDTSASDWYIYQLERFAELIRAEAIAAEREAIIQEIPGGYSVDPQWVCDMIRARMKR